MKIIAATAVTMFSLFTVFSATVAWLAANKLVDSDGGLIKVTDVNRLFSEMTLHRYLGKDDSGNLLFDQVPGGSYSYGSSGTEYNNNSSAPSGSSALPANQMENYSLSNPRHPVLAIIKLNQVVDTTEVPFSILARTSHHYLGESENGEPLEELVTLNNPLSSIIRFSTNHFEETADITSKTTQVEGVSYNTFVFTDPDTITSSTDERNWKSFVSFTSSGEELIFNSWTQELEVINSNNFATGAETNVGCVTMIFDYYDDAINYVYNMYLGNDILNEEFVHFSCDWTLVI